MELPIKASDHSFRVLGMMSGTSMDALDMAQCSFRFDPVAKQWLGKLDQLIEVPIEPLWKERLSGLFHGSAIEWFECERDWSRWCGQAILDHFDTNTLDLVVFSGQTIFHRPNLGWTAQVGSGAELHAILDTKIPVVHDLRSLDVALEGNGAPLVPMADALLFNEFEACLNLGGFANASFDIGGKRIAWDIGPCNLVLNSLAERLGKPFDDSGRLARSGQVLSNLFDGWMALEYHHLPPPKSLGVEWLHTHFWPVLDAIENEMALTVEDILATATAYIAATIQRDVGRRKTLVTGGGAFNEYLLELLAKPTWDGSSELKGLDLIVPDSVLIRGKEAYAFAFLGLLRMLGKENVLAEVTGATRSHIGGALWGHIDVSSHAQKRMQ